MVASPTVRKKILFIGFEYIKMKNENLPLLQRVPLYPKAQVQVKPLIWSLHTAEFWHGLELHSLNSKRRKKEIKYALYA